MSLTWYDYEDLVRALVRSWGFKVEYQPVVKYNKEIDVYGEHEFLYEYDSSNKKRKWIFIGECKRWAQPIGRDIIDAFSTIRDDFQREESPVIAAVASYSVFSKNAEDAALKRKIMLIRQDDVLQGLKNNFLDVPAGSTTIKRKSLPNYPKDFKHIEAILAAANQLQKKQFTATDLIPLLEKDPRFEYDRKKWTGDAVQIACLFRLVQQTGKKGNAYLYSLTREGYSYILSSKTDDEMAKETLKIMAVKLPWIREVLLYLGTMGPQSMSKVARELEYLRAGFDKASLKIAIDIARDLELIVVKGKKAFITEVAKEYLWNRSDPI